MSDNFASPPFKSAVLHRVRRFFSLRHREPPHGPDQLDPDTPMIQNRIKSSTSSSPSPRIHEFTVPWLLHEAAIAVSFLSTQQPVSPDSSCTMMCKSMCQEYRAWDLGIMTGMSTMNSTSTIKLGLT